MGDSRDLVAALEAVVRTGDFAQIGGLVMTHATDDFVQEWPQSGERMTKAQAMQIGESYEAGSGTSPSFTYRRILHGDDLIVLEGAIDYGDGVPVSYVGIGEVRDGKLARVTEYFANPFEIPSWRAELSGRMEGAPA